MTQNIIALLLVGLATTYTFYSLIRNFRSKKISKCDGCSGCELKKSIGCS